MNKVSANRILSIAKSQIGYVEGANNYSKYGDWYNQPGYANAAWCAMFVSWCFEQAGSPLPAIQHPKGFAYCPFGVNYFRKLGKFYNSPRVGDIVFFDWQGDGTSDHVGFVLEVKDSKNIITIEGNTSYRNQSHGGQVMKRSRLVRLCQGFARPDYSNDDGAPYFSKTDIAPTWKGVYLRLQSPMIRSTDVSKVQAKLAELGYRIAADGYFGNQSKNAILRFQASKGLEVDGVVGRNTWNALFR